MGTSALLAIFFVAAYLGYKVISQVPPLLHTPLMSGMNGLSGVTIVGSVVVTAYAVSTGSQILGFIAITFATIKLAGGFFVTNRMLKMFKVKQKGEVLK
ncbi:NAD(P) transhydrogenase subunit alpha [Desulfitibacter alkalitolerans]|uniref:NAD(P) transhydrogenase subunit alpha n=1 Tax=Desulfitibacter alkalitolerans TaxID=264641 RepID=UPI0004874C7D|nr:NAD(P) transhydrogenase subunit alpha [Desulfitibacter alkalitolerans]